MLPVYIANQSMTFTVEKIIHFQLHYIRFKLKSTIVVLNLGAVNF